MANGEESISESEFQEIKRLVGEIRDQKRKQREKEGVRRLTESSQKLARKVTPEKPSRRQVDISKLKKPSIEGRDAEISRPARKPVNDSERMWVVSWWENRKKMDPTFDPDQWFKSSMHMDNKQRLEDIEDFWTGKGQNDTTSFWTSSMWGI